MTPPSLCPPLPQETGSSLYLTAKRPSQIATHVIREFQGLETADKTTKQAMMEFSYHLSVGNMDEAFKAIKTIKRSDGGTDHCRCAVTDVIAVRLEREGSPRARGVQHTGIY